MVLLGTGFAAELMMQLHAGVIYTLDQKYCRSSIYGGSGASRFPRAGSCATSSGAGTGAAVITGCAGAGFAARGALFAGAPVADVFLQPAGRWFAQARSNH